eukprot:3291791-Rhodomonas_salina.3
MPHHTLRQYRTPRSKRVGRQRTTHHVSTGHRVASATAASTYHTLAQYRTSRSKRTTAVPDRAYASSVPDTATSAVGRYPPPQYCAPTRPSPPQAPASSIAQVRTPRHQIQESTVSVQVVPGMRFLVFDFGVDHVHGSSIREASTGHRIASA